MLAIVLGPPFAPGEFVVIRRSLLATALLLLPACARPLPADEPAEPTATLGLVALDIESPDIDAHPRLLAPIGEEAQVEMSLPNGESVKVTVKVAVVEDSQHASKVLEQWTNESPKSE